MRDNKYLKERLETIWSEYFSDVPRSNLVRIHFGRRAVRRLGSIRKVFGSIRPSAFNKRDHFDTMITINGHFKDSLIPDYVIDATIAHELCHYAHGFSSPLPQLSKFPHRGGLVDLELKERGLITLIQIESKWLDHNWHTYISKYFHKHR